MIQYTIIRRVVEEQSGDYELTDKQRMVLIETVLDFARAAETVKNYAESLRRSMERLERNAGKAMAFQPMAINSNGEAGSRSDDVDRSCAILHERSAKLATVCYAFDVDREALVAALQDALAGTEA